MGATNERVLKSLAALEQNLKDITSASEQVNNVVGKSDELVKAIGSYKAILEGLSTNVKSILEDSRKFNLESVTKLSEQADKFSAEVEKLNKFDVSATLRSIEPKVVAQFQNNLVKPLESLKAHTSDINKEVTRLTKYNFREPLKKIENEIISQFNSDLQKQLGVLDDKWLELQSIIDDLKGQIIRLEQVDLASLLSDLQSVLIDNMEKNHVELSEKYAEVKSRIINIGSRLDNQDKEINSLKTLLLLTIGILVAGIVLSLVV